MPDKRKADEDYKEIVVKRGPFLGRAIPLMSLGTRNSQLEEFFVGLHSRIYH